ncbi:MAG: SRPBCC family protein [Acidimicrobiales bacterium]
MTDETRTIDLSVEVPGTPEEVWEAIATGPGISSWFVTCGVDEEVGGSVSMDFGGVRQETGKVTVWEPPTRVVFEGPGGKDDGRVLAYEWLVEAREGGTCLVRLVNRGFGTGEEWDGDYDGLTQGWKVFLGNLRLHLTHFRGRHARALTPVAVAPGPNSAAWGALCSALGVSPTLEAGDRLTTSGEGVPPLTGVLQGARRSEAISEYRMLLDGPAAGTALVAAEGRGEQVALSVWLYLYGDAAPGEGDWAAWLEDRFPATQPES